MDEEVESRSPHGERGLKFEEAQAQARLAWSLPPRGAWIEMVPSIISAVMLHVAPPTGSVD